MNVYNHMQDWIYATNELSVCSKLILQRLVSLSKDGEQTVFCSRDSLNKELGLPLRTITRSFKELLDKSFIELADNPNKFNRTRFFKITAKTRAEHPSQIGQIDLAKNTLDPSQIGQIDLAKNTLDPSQIGHPILAKLATSSLDRSVGRYKDDSVVVDPTEESARARTTPTISEMETVDEFDPMDELPPPEDPIPTQITYNAQNASKAPQMTNYPSESKIAPPARYTNEIEGNKSTPRTKPSQRSVLNVVYPKNAEEVIPYIEKYKAQHPEMPDIDKLDVNAYARKLFDWYCAPYADGKWRDKRGCVLHVIQHNITAWLNRDAESGKLILIKDKKTQQSIADSERELKDFANRLEVAAGRMTPEEYMRLSGATNADYTVIDQNSIISKIPLLNNGEHHG